MVRLGIDVGGTFTDVVVIDEAKGTINLTKTPSVPQAPNKAVINGINKIVDMYDVDLSQVDFLIHGTTVATNALIERKGVPTALITTKGFRDVLHIARQSRPKLYDYFSRRPDSFIAREYRFEVDERMLYTGEVQVPLDEDEVRKIAKILVDEGIGIVAVCLLHSYANPSHELRIRDILKETAPELRVCLSCETLPEYKEYERSSTTVINAYVMPIIEQYLGKIQKEIKKMGIQSDLHIMQSNGGVATSQEASKKSVQTVLSCPAAGLLGGLVTAKMIDIEDIITVDMGGTSFDVSLASGGKPSYTVESDIDGHIIKVPMIDIKTLGAGGGSIAWVDAGGALQVGPESAGADPGPVCYMRGGTRPTVSDANAVLGYLNPEFFANGDMGLDIEGAKKAIYEHIAKPMDLTVEEAAEGILKVVNATMVRGIRMVSVERGHDARKFALVCFGGAGPVHAVALAKQMNIQKLIVPEAPGVNCALGLLMADFRHDYSKTFLHNLWNLDSAALSKEYAQMEQGALMQLVEEHVHENDIIFHRSADLRYKGQGYELELSIPNIDQYSAEDLRTICRDYSNTHKDKYGYAMEDEFVEIVNIRLTAIGLLSKPKLAEEPYVGEDCSAAIKGMRRVYMDGTYKEINIYDRRKLRHGNKIFSPAIVEQADSTTVLFEGYDAIVDKYRNLIIEQRKEYTNEPQKC